MYEPIRYAILDFNRHSVLAHGRYVCQSSIWHWECWPDKIFMALAPVQKTKPVHAMKKKEAALELLHE